MFKGSGVVSLTMLKKNWKGKQLSSENERVPPSPLRFVLAAVFAAVAHQLGNFRNPARENSLTEWDKQTSKSGHIEYIKIEIKIIKKYGVCRAENE